jgi:predicted MPP superfamily phosphohydrolase
MKFIILLYFTLNANLNERWKKRNIYKNLIFFTIFYKFTQIYKNLSNFLQKNEKMYKKRKFSQKNEKWSTFVNFYKFYKKIEFHSGILISVEFCDQRSQVPRDKNFLARGAFHKCHYVASCHRNSFITMSFLTKSNDTF